MKLTPKIKAPVTAVRLREGLVAERGSWLIINDDDTVQVLSDEQVRAVFNVGAVTDGGARHRVPTVSNGRRVNGSVQVDLLSGVKLTIGAQSIRILEALAKQPGGEIRSDSLDLIRRTLGERDQTQVTGRLHDAEVKKLVIKETIAGMTNRYTWRLTNEGRAIAQTYAAEASRYA